MVVKNAHRMPVLLWWLKCYMPKQTKYFMAYDCRLAIS